ncbi:hypothetical protein KAH94_03030, partial [bacterium]|nr:hypothetical protein [bacterium]
MNKRGISGVVVTVILIAMAVGLVAIVWVVVANMVDEGLGSAVSGSSRVALEIDDSGIKTNDAGYYVKVDRKVGEGELAKIKFILTDSEDKSEVVEYTSDMGESESSRFNFGMELFGEGKLKDLVEVKVIPIIVLDEQEKELGATDTLDIEEMPVTAEDGLIGYWKFDNTFSDSSGNGNDGVNNGVEFVEDSERGTVALFNKDTSNPKTIEIDSFADDVDLSQDFTISSWINPVKVGTGDFSMMGCYGGSTNGFIYKIDNLGKTFGIWSGGSWKQRSILSNFFNTWSNVVVVGSSSGVQIYVDGKPEGAPHTAVTYNSYP